MGKGTLIIVLVSSMTASAMYLSRDEGMFMSASETAEYEAKVIARETAHSGFNVLVGKVKRDFENYRGNYSDLTYGQAFYDISALEGENDEVVLTAVGKFGNYEYEISGSIFRSSDRLLDALTIDGALDGFTMSGSGIVSGIDALQNGKPGPGPNVHAVLATGDEEYQVLLAGGHGDRMQGLDGESDVEDGSPEVDLDELESAIRNYSGSALVHSDGNASYNNTTLGTRSNRKVVKVEGDVVLKGSTSGNGILYITGGNLLLQDEATWTGLVFVNNPFGGSHIIEDNGAIYGAVVIRTGENSGEIEYGFGEDEEDEQDDGCAVSEKSSKKHSKKYSKKHSKKSSKKSDKSSCDSKKHSKKHSKKSSKKSDKSDQSGSNNFNGNNNDKVYVCHAPPGNIANKHSISVGSSSSLSAHLAHGDSEGICESDVFTVEGDPMLVTIRNNGQIHFSSAALRPLKDLLAQIDLDENGFKVNAVGEDQIKIDDAVMIKR